MSSPTVSRRDLLLMLGGTTAAAIGAITCGAGPRVAQAPGASAVASYHPGEPCTPPRVGAPMGGHTSWITSVAWSPDGRFLVTGSKDSTAKLWDLATRTCIMTLNHHSKPVHGVAISPSGCEILTASMDGTVGLSRIDGQTELDLQGHTATVDSVAFFPNGKRAMSAASDSTIKIWDLESAECIKTLEGGGQYGNAVMSRDGSRCLSFDVGSAKLWDMESGTVVRVFKDTLTPATLAPNGKLVAVSLHDNKVGLFDLDSEGTSPKVTFDGAPNSPPGRSSALEAQALAFSNDGTVLLVGANGGSARIFDTKGTLLHELKGHDNETTILAVAIAPDGKTAMTAGDDATMKHWDVASGALLGAFV